MIKEFKGDYSFLSNYYTAWQESTYDGINPSPDMISLIQKYPIAEITGYNIIYPANEVRGAKMTVRYRTNENFYQAYKADNWEQHLAIASAHAPWVAKRMGSPRGYKDFKIVLRHDWKDIMLNVMRIGLNLKFRQNPKLARRLIATNPQVLQEGNWWYDDFWGVCFRKGTGANWLGILLMELRNNLILENRYS